jgi:hypothetical protein
MFDYACHGGMAEARSMGYVETFNELHRWWESLRLTHDDDKIILALKECVDNETDPDRLQILNHFLVKEHLAQGNPAAAEALQRSDTLIEIHRWCSDSLRNARYDVDMRPVIEDRIRNEADPRRLDALRFCLKSEHQRHRDFAAAEALLLADIAAHPDESMPLIFLADLPTPTARPAPDRAAAHPSARSCVVR